MCSSDLFSGVENMVLDAGKKAPADTAYMFVRFGNVLGSRGSILPLFIDQIKKGGPVTVTDPQMVRYFMTIPEACSLVLKTGGVGKNGNSYLLDMGEPVKIIEIAEQLIRFMGYEPGKDIPVSIIGSRPGERLDEPLWSRREKPMETDFPRILKLERSDEDKTLDLDSFMEEIRPICLFDPEAAHLYRNRKELYRILAGHVPGIKEGRNGGKHER